MNFDSMFTFLFTATGIASDSNWLPESYTDINYFLYF